MSAYERGRELGSDARTDHGRLMNHKDVTREYVGSHVLPRAVRERTRRDDERDELRAMRKEQAHLRRIGRGPGIYYR